MISSNLIENIMMFVNRLGAVHREQLITMFSDGEDDSTINACIWNLVGNSSVNYNENTDTILRRNSVNESDFKQRMITRAVWVLADMGSVRVRDYFVTEYPSQIFIIGENNTCYDVTVFTYDTLKSLRMTVTRKRQSLLPQDIDDECIHIALLPDKEMVPDVKALPFDTYCILNENNVPEYYEF